MERLVQFFDELEDLVSVLRHRLGLWPAAARPARRTTRA
jgi:hypothetical protein